VSDFSSPSDSRSSAPIDLDIVRRLFAHPEKVAESNFLRREIAGRMRERLELVKIAPERILDAGCGEGGDIGELLQLFPASHIVGADASWAMLQTVQGRQAGVKSSMNRLLGKWIPEKMATRLQSAAGLVCSDFANLPLAGNSVDLLWSNLALHWHPQPDRVFAEWRRLLRVNGLLMFSCFGPDTFQELRSAFASTGKNTAVLSFVDMHDFGDMLVHTGFSTPVMDMEKITVTYDSVEKLIADVRAWGGNPLSTRMSGLLGGQAWNRIRQELESNRRADGKVPLTFEVIYGHAFRPVPKKTAAGESIVRFDLPKK
jgi:malonyl-CoA O-methyltransferase